MDAFDVSQIDDVIHGRLRLGVMSYLSGSQSADFNELKTRLQASDGNLSVQLSKLKEAGYVSIKKSFHQKKPLTRITLTEKGREAFIAYLAALQKLLPGKAD
jgi:DNA-binding HxlR family transcriptional regulator